MKFINPYIEIHDGLCLRWSEFTENKNRYLEFVWNKGEAVNCLCNGVNSKIELGVGKKNGDFYVFKKGDVAHAEQCPVAHLSKKGEYLDKETLGNMQFKLEDELLRMGISYWTPKFYGKRNKSWFRHKFTSEFKHGLLFYPEFGEENVEINNKELESLVNFCGDEFYVAGFIYDFSISDTDNGSFFKIKGYDKRFFVDKNVAEIIRKHTSKFDFFCLFKFIVKKNGFYVGVDGSGIYIDKVTLTPHYWKKIDVDKERLFSCYLCNKKETVVKNKKEEDI